MNAMIVAALAAHLIPRSMMRWQIASAEVAPPDWASGDKSKRRWIDARNRLARARCITQTIQIPIRIQLELASAKFAAQNRSANFCP